MYSNGFRISYYAYMINAAKAHRLMQIKALRERRDPVLFKKINLALIRRKHASIRVRLWRKHRQLFLLTVQQYRQILMRPCFFCGMRFLPANVGIVRQSITKGFYWENVSACCDSCLLAKKDPLIS